MKKSKTMPATREERQRLAERAVILSLQSLRINGGILRDFFSFVFRKTHQLEDDLIDTIDGGVQKYHSENLRRVMFQQFSASAQFMVDGMKGEITWPYTIPTPEILKHSKYKRDRRMLTVSIMDLMVSKFDEFHVNLFRDTVSFWRNELEVIRMSKFLEGQPAYTAEIRHVDLFLKILQTPVSVE